MIVRVAAALDRVTSGANVAVRCAGARAVARRMRARADVVDAWADQDDLVIVIRMEGDSPYDADLAIRGEALDAMGPLSLDVYVYDESKCPRRA